MWLVTERAQGSVHLVVAPKHLALTDVDIAIYPASHIARDVFLICRACPISKFRLQLCDRPLVSAESMYPCGSSPSSPGSCASAV